ALLLELTNAAELGVGAVLGVLTNAAGIQDDDVGPFHAVGGLEAETRETCRQLLAVGLVHLTADGPEVVLHGKASGASDGPMPVAPSSGGRQVVSGEVAERVGFEPTTEVSPGKRLAGARTRPLCDLSAVIVASDEGFGHPQRC